MFTNKDWVIGIQDEIIKGLYEKNARLEKKLEEKKETELLPCPHCGGKAIWWETEDKTYPYQIICKACQCGTDETDIEQEAIDDWNRRV